MWHRFTTVAPLAIDTDVRTNCFILHESWLPTQGVSCAHCLSQGDEVSLPWLHPPEQGDLQRPWRWLMSSSVTTLYRYPTTTDLQGMREGMCDVTTCHVLCWYIHLSGPSWTKRYCRFSSTMHRHVPSPGCSYHAADGAVKGYKNNSSRHPPSLRHILCLLIISNVLSTIFVMNKSHLNWYEKTLHLVSCTCGYFNILLSLSQNGVCIASCSWPHVIYT